MRNLRGQVALYSPAARGKLSSPQRGGQTINLSVHPSTETGQLQSFVEENLDSWLDEVGQYCPWSAQLLSVEDYR